MDEYLKLTEIIDWKHHSILEKAKAFSNQRGDVYTISKHCFEWVRDNIKHSRDFCLNPVTCKASEVLKHLTGYCYAKNHLLVALLRANSIPSGFCYQRLSRDDNGPPFVLHGLTAIYLSKIGWYRVDPRGNKEGVNAQFEPPKEHLAFHINLEGEADLPEVWSDPLPVIVNLLQNSKTYNQVWENLPDVEIIHELTKRWGRY
ncbi:MAG: transglutaminase family protein [bacterium]